MIIIIITVVPAYQVSCIHSKAAALLERSHRHRCFHAGAVINRHPTPDHNLKPLLIPSFRACKLYFSGVLFQRKRQAAKAAAAIAKREWEGDRAAEVLKRVWRWGIMMVMMIVMMVMVMVMMMVMTMMMTTKTTTSANFNTCITHVPHKPHAHPLPAHRHRHHCSLFSTTRTLHRRLAASTLLQKTFRRHISLKTFSFLQRSNAAISIQSAIRIHRARFELSQAALAYVTRMQNRAVIRAVAVWRGFWQRKLYLAGVKRRSGTERRMNANTLFRNWSSHLVRAVMKIAGRRVLRAFVVHKVC
jgi:hypothetical protein